VEIFNKNGFELWTGEYGEIYVRTKRTESLFGVKGDTVCDSVQLTESDLIELENAINRYFHHKPHEA